MKNCFCHKTGLRGMIVLFNFRFLRLNPQIWDSRCVAMHRPWAWWWLSGNLVRRPLLAYQNIFIVISYRGLPRCLQITEPVWRGDCRFKDYSGAEIPGQMAIMMPARRLYSFFSVVVVLEFWGIPINLHFVLISWNLGCRTRKWTTRNLIELLQRSRRDYATILQFLYDSR